MVHNFYGNGGIAHLGDVGSPPLNFTDCNVGHPSEQCIVFCVEFHGLQRRHSSGRCIDLCDTPDAVCAMVEQLQFMTMVNGFCDNGVLQNLYDVDPPIEFRRLQRRASVRTMYWFWRNTRDHSLCPSMRWMHSSDGHLGCSTYSQHACSTEQLTRDLLDEELTEEMHIRFTPTKVKEVGRMLSALA